MESQAQKFMERRKCFPRGLSQPDKGFRFSVDSLLLSCFANPGKGGRVLDLGTGCGVIPIGLYLRNPDKGLRITGLERQSEMLECTRANIEALELEEVFELTPGDVRDRGTVRPESFDLVLANPPFRESGRGRGCPDGAKQNARFEENGSLGDFVEAASFAVRNRGRVCFVFLAERLADLIREFSRVRLEPKRVRLCHGRMDEPARIVLVEAVKNGKPGLEIEPPLILYPQDKDNTQPRAQALAFCPYLEK